MSKKQPLINISIQTPLYIDRRVRPTYPKQSPKSNQHNKSQQHSIIANNTLNKIHKYTHIINLNHKTIQWHIKQTFILKYTLKQQLTKYFQNKYQQIQQLRKRNHQKAIQSADKLNRVLIQLLNDRKKIYSLLKHCCQKCKKNGIEGDKEKDLYDNCDDCLAIFTKFFLNCSESNWKQNGQIDEIKQQQPSFYQHRNSRKNISKTSIILSQSQIKNKINNNQRLQQQNTITILDSLLDTQLYKMYTRKKVPTIKLLTNKLEQSDNQQQSEQQIIDQRYRKQRKKSHFYNQKQSPGQQSKQSKQQGQQQQQNKRMKQQYNIEQYNKKMNQYSRRLSASDRFFSVIRQVLKTNNSNNITTNIDNTNNNYNNNYNKQNNQQYWLQQQHRYQLQLSQQQDLQQQQQQADNSRKYTTNLLNNDKQQQQQQQQQQCNVQGYQNDQTAHKRYKNNQNRRNKLHTYNATPNKFILNNYRKKTTMKKITMKSINVNGNKNSNQQQGDINNNFNGNNNGNGEKNNSNDRKNNNDRNNSKNRNNSKSRNTSNRSSNKSKTKKYMKKQPKKSKFNLKSNKVKNKESGNSTNQYNQYNISNNTQNNQQSKTKNRFPKYNKSMSGVQRMVSLRRINQRQAFIRKTNKNKQSKQNQNRFKSGQSMQSIDRNIIQQEQQTNSIQLQPKLTKYQQARQKFNTKYKQQLMVLSFAKNLEKKNSNQLTPNNDNLLNINKYLVKRPSINILMPSQRANRSSKRSRRKVSLQDMYDDLNRDSSNQTISTNSYRKCQQQSLMSKFHKFTSIDKFDLKSLKNSIRAYLNKYQHQTNGRQLLNFFTYMQLSLQKQLKQKLKYQQTDIIESQLQNSQLQAFINAQFQVSLNQQYQQYQGCSNLQEYNHVNNSDLKKQEYQQRFISRLNNRVIDLMYWNYQEGDIDKGQELRQVSLKDIQEIIV